MNDSNISYDLLIDRINKGPITTIYTITNGVNSICFDTLEEREEYINSNKLPICVRYTIEYYGNVANKKNIMREINPGLGPDFNRTISVSNRDFYEIIDMELSKNKNSVVTRSSTDGASDKLVLLEAIAKKIEKNKELGRSK